MATHNLLIPVFDRGVLDQIEHRKRGCRDKRDSKELPISGNQEGYGRNINRIHVLGEQHTKP